MQALQTATLPSQLAQTWRGVFASAELTFAAHSSQVVAPAESRIRPYSWAQARPEDGGAGRGMMLSAHGSWWEGDREAQYRAWVRASRSAAAPSWTHTWQARQAGSSGSSWWCCVGGKGGRDEVEVTAVPAAVQRAAADPSHHPPAPSPPLTYPHTHHWTHVAVSRCRA